MGSLPKNGPKSKACEPAGGPDDDAEFLPIVGCEPFALKFRGPGLAKTRPDWLVIEPLYLGGRTDGD